MARSQPRLFVRDGDRIVEAPEADQQVAEQYPKWATKGRARDGIRLTIMTASSQYGPGDAVRVVHVLEATGPGVPLHVMGPKEVRDEYVDGELRTPPVPPGVDPLLPPSYDGRVLDGPGVDVNWEITVYRFDDPGEHTIAWRPGELRSNTLRLDIK
jgi:hypothetical protein